MPRLAATGHRDATAEALSREAHPLTGSANDYDPLLELIGDASLVLLGRPRTGRTSSIASEQLSPAG